jgi:hypothetical protein
MDLKVYYQKIRDLEQSMEDESPVVMSHETPDGGREGLFNEAPRAVAAKMVVDGKARLASEEETRTYRERKAEEKRQADQISGASRMQVTVGPHTPNGRRKRG